jgi:2-oxoglutarate dehydrogenase E1 component
MLPRVRKGPAVVTSHATNPHDNPLAGFGPNEWIVEEMYQRYLTDPSSVDSAWHDFFADYRPDPTGPVSRPG